MRAQLLQPKNILIGIIAQLVFITAVMLISAPKVSAAACDTANTFGTVTTTVAIPSNASYRVWSRIAVPDTTNNSYYLEIDGTTCITVGDNSSIPVDAGMTVPLNWQWVDYQAGTTTNKINVTLTAGNHNIKLIGKEASVAVDRVVFTSDMACVPTGTGDNCASPPDTTPPVVSITAPANNATVPGNNASVAVNITATDDVAMQKVELYIDNVLRDTDTTSPFGFTLNATTLSPGSHTLRARAYDTSTSGNPVNSTNVTITVTDSAAPTAVTFTTPANNAQIVGSQTVTATAADNVGIQRIDFFLDNSNTPLASDAVSPYSFSLNTTSPVIANGPHTLKATAFDAAGNATPASITINVNNPVVPPPDTAAPTVTVTNPTAGATVSGNAYKLSANASDTSGIKQVESYIDGQSKNVDTAPPYEYTFDSNTLTNASHTFGARATDNSTNANVSGIVNVTATVNNFTHWAEDIDQDRTVGPLDFIRFKSKYGQTNYTGREDIDGDRNVGPLDFIRFKSKYGQTY